jgi:hypothetical protein
MSVVSLCLGRMMINLDVAATAYYQGGSLLELAVKILDRRNIGKEKIEKWNAHHVT